MFDPLFKTHVSLKEGREPMPTHGLIQIKRGTKLI